MQLTYIDELYAKITRSNNLQEELNELDVIEFVREALPQIDQYDQWEKKKFRLNIKDHKALMPTDFYAFDSSQSKVRGRIQAGYLYTSQKEGILDIYYLAFAMDDQSPSRPLIPSSQEYMQALMHYCVAYMCRNGTILPSEEVNYTKEYQKWIEKKGEARADANLARVGDIREEVINNFLTFTKYDTNPQYPSDYQNY